MRGTMGYMLRCRPRRFPPPPVLQHHYPNQGVRRRSPTRTLGLINDARRALITLPFHQPREPDLHPFPSRQPLLSADLKERRLALLATGGSGALASVVGAARALEEAGVRPAVISLCSGSALFGFPIAAGIPADEVAAFTLSLRPDEYVDVDWRMLASLIPSGGHRVRRHHPR